MSPVAEIIEAVLKSLTDRFALAGLFLAILFLLFAELLPNTAIGGWSSSHLVLVYGVGLFSLCYLPTRHIIEGVDGYLSSRKANKTKHSRLHGLTKDECVVLPAKTGLPDSV